ncbi:MAG: type I DNA topoisomerase [Sphingobacteriia bacterium]|nr:type I DNA topoisomerase [Sphingobacteriia bacterium]
MNLLIVESPAKAKTINKYLGSDFKVMASYGHIRDLPSKNGSVMPDNDFEMIYEVNSESEKHVKVIAEAAKNAKIIYLATDPDREGEAISWHVIEILRKKKAINKDTEIKRVVFNEITKKAVQNAVKNPRDIDINLVNAQQARRALDYLVGFNVSPVLWRKLPGSKSAGRVQSVALKLICERESEIEKFVTQEYYTVKGLFLSNEKSEFEAALNQINKKRIEKFDFKTAEQVQNIVNDIKTKDFFVSEIEKKQISRNPQPPFTTSSLQQEASRKLGFSAKQTMTIAQKLYEGIDIQGETIGLITYMRTDGVQIAEEALKDTRNYILNKYGKDYLPSNARMYQTKAKNAQEAHEAIRPTHLDLPPEKVKNSLDSKQLGLYELIWKRLIASQMESVIFDSIGVNLEDKDKKYTFRATGSTIKFDGFYKVYKEGQDDTLEDEEGNKLLPSLKEGQQTEIKDVKGNQHFTEPPPRYSEASLVKKLEELGIGRPSTYASIISVIQDRQYVRLDKRRFIPEERGRLVTAFLDNFFTKYVQYDFTAQMEEKLDHISAGELQWKSVLKEFWIDFIDNVQSATKKPMEEILKVLDKVLEDHIFPNKEHKENVRKCPECEDGKLELKIGKYGAFVGCSNYPECDYKKALNQIINAEVTNNSEDGSQSSEDTKKTSFPKTMGIDPNTGLKIVLKIGPYGPYVQLGDDTVKGPKRIAIPKSYKIDEMTLEDCFKLVALPKELGMHPDDNQKIVLAIGKFGPYLQHSGKFYSLGKIPNFLSITLEEACEIIANNPNKTASKATAKKSSKAGSKSKTEQVAIELGEYKIFKGPFGMLYLYNDDKKINFPRGTKTDQITKESIEKLINK